MFIFLLGIVEMLIVTAWTESVTKAKVLASGAITTVNVLIWYYILNRIMDNIDNTFIVVVYAIGCAIGTMIGTYYLSQREKKQILKSNLMTESYSK
ncbi:MAG: DUF5698 domain-containing protein [Candidatus Paceibacterota bacterium]|jgi:uncharacterized protein YebE (UPF0316 family)